MSCSTGAVSYARRRASQAEVQGIDYVDVLDFAAPSDELRVRMVLIHTFSLAWELTGADVHIEAASGSAPLHVEWAFAADRLPEPELNGELQLVAHGEWSARGLSDPEREYFSNLPDAEKILVVHISHAIDPAENMALYTLSLSGQEAIDPRLATFEFTLHAEGAVDFDCARVERKALVRSPSPPIDYLSKDYSSFRQLMLDRMAVVMPEWTKRNVGDIGVALVEILAYAGDHLSYYQDAVATEAYLGTARRRTSVRRHARLLDYALHEGNNARVWICFEADPLASPETVFPAGTQIITKLGNYADVVVRDNILGEALQQGAVFFETMFPIQLRANRNRIPFYDWCGAIQCLEKGATEATLMVPFDDGDPWLTPGEVLVFEEIDDPKSDIQADSSHRHAVCLTEVKLVVDALEGSQLTAISWHEEDALPFALPLRHSSGEPAALAWGNVVLADHGRTVIEEDLRPEKPPIGERYRPRLSSSHITHRTAADGPEMRKRPATAHMVQDPRKALPAVSVVEIPELVEILDDVSAEASLLWYPRRDLLASGPFDRHVAIEIENDGMAHLRFGDDMYGRRPSTRSRWQTNYRVGNGRAGNIGGNALAHIMISADPVVERPRVVAVRNPLPAVGGTDPERDQQARLYAPYAFRIGERAVTSDDYAEITERHPQVQKAVADIHWTGSWNTVFVTVDRRGGQPLDLELEAELRSFLEPFRMAGQDLEFQPPDFVPLDIAFTAHVAHDHLRSEVHAALIEALGSGTSADGKPGFFHPDQFTFGEPVYLSHLVARAMEVPGVMWIDVDDTGPRPNRFRRFGEPSLGELGAGVITVGRLQIIRVDNDPVAPHNGRLRLFMEGGL